MTTDLKALKATAQATAEKSPTLLVTVPAGVMVELIKDVERYRWLKLQRSKVWREAADVPMNHTDAHIDAAMAKEDK